MKKGLLHIYCGDGKGKTTAATGLAVRALGRGFKVCVIRLMKDNDSGELASLEKLGAHIAPAPDSLKFVWLMTEEEKDAYKARVRLMLSHAQGDYDLIIIDEACSAVSTGMLELDSLLEIIDGRPRWQEMVLTGRDPCPELCERADYITEMKKIKHPYDSGIASRDGIER